MGGRKELNNCPGKKEVTGKINKQVGMPVLWSQNLERQAGNEVWPGVWGPAGVVFLTV